MFFYLRGGSNYARTMRAILLLVMCVAITAISSAQDTLFMKGGQVHPVKIISQNDQFIVVKNEKKKKVHIQLDGIERIFTCKFKEDSGEKDTGTRAIFSNFEVIGISGSGLPVRGGVMYVDNIYVVGIHLFEDLGCVKPNESDVQIILESGTHMSFRHFGEEQCDVANLQIATMLLYGDLEDINEENIPTIQLSVLDKLKKEKVSYMRIYGSEFYTDVQLTEQGKYFIRDGIICIMRALDN